ncbi:MAG TPA: type I polyketide synthase, partial [Streptomyces sp.]
MNGVDVARTAGKAEADEIAVVGLSCRLPKAADPAAFWRLLRDGVDAVGAAPDDRWIGDTHSPRRGGFLDQIDHFDADFFGISPREAVAMDPRQRLLLELSWEALEDTRIVPTTLRGSRTGVFVGAMGDDYAVLTSRLGQETIGQHTLTGSSRAIIANRVSRFLGLRGPSLTVDTAQSSSLVAVHMACESLRRGESTVAIAGGVSLNILAESTVSAWQIGALSPDGRCHTFDARANGYARGEGGAVVVLKKLDDALADGDKIYCVIAGGAVNNEGEGDGEGSGLTVPSRSAQTDVIQEAYQRASVDPAEVQYVELHGTGTKVGDPIEAAALGAALGTRRPAESPLLVGSVKTNVGHLEGAAGITGMLKVVLSLRHRVLPPSLNFVEANPDIPLDELRLRVHTRLADWPEGGRRLVAGVSAFGMGGTNCHLVLAEAPVRIPEGAPAESSAPVVSSPVVPWVVSGRSESALREQAGRLAAYVEAVDPVDVGAALVSTRASLEHRAVVLGADRDELIAGLAGLSAGEPGAGVVAGVADRSAAGGRGVVFVFPGQGSQWVGMAQGLLGASPVFAERMRECARALAPFVEWDLLEVLGDQEALERTDVVQPALWAVMVSLAEVWRSLGVTPAAVVGHSQGEIAAACVAGGLSLDDAARIITVRSRLLDQELSGRGGMASVRLPLAELESLLARWEGRLSVAAVNGLSWVVVSGDTDAVIELVAAGEAEGFRVRRMAADGAGHSAQVERIRGELVESLAGIRSVEGRVAFYSTVTRELTDTRELDAEYWYRNARETVRFADTARALAAAGYGTFLEISPHPVLVPSLEETLFESHPAAVVTGTLRRSEDESEQLLAAAARLYVRGVPVEWAAVVGSGSSVVDLPTYAFQRERYWPEAVSEPSGVDDELWSVVREADAGALSVELGVDEGAVAEVVPALAAWRERRRARSAVEGWRYEENWKLLPGASGVVLSGSWLVVVPAGFGEDAWVASVVEALGAGVVEMEGDVDRAALEGLPELTGVVSLLGLVGSEATPVGLSGTVGLVRALGECGIAAPVWCVTRGAVSV